MKSNKVIHHTGRDGNVYSDVETEIESLRTRATALETDVAAVETSVSDLETQAQAWRAPDVIIEDQKAQNTAGGTATSGSWQTRTLNTIVRNVSTLASLSSNQITLPAGTYFASWSAPASYCFAHQTRLQNITGTATLGTGSSERSPNTTTDPVQTRSVGSCVFTLSGSSAVELQHQVNTTRATSGFGLPANFTTEVYSRVEIYKIA